MQHQNTLNQPNMLINSQKKDLTVTFLLFFETFSFIIPNNIPKYHSNKCLGETLLMDGWSCSDSRDAQHVRAFKYPSARLIMAGRKVRAHNLVSSLDNNWEVETVCDEKIKMVIVFLLELKASFFAQLNSREKFLAKMPHLKKRGNLKRNYV